LGITECVKDYLKKSIDAANKAKPVDLETLEVASNLMKPFVKEEKVVLLRSDIIAIKEETEPEDSSSHQSGSDDDWDAEIGINSKKRQVLVLEKGKPLPDKKVLVLQKPVDKEEIIPSRYKLLETVKNEVEIVK
jgi:hypothetical protein